MSSREASLTSVSVRLFVWLVVTVGTLCSLHVPSDGGVPTEPQQQLLLLRRLDLIRPQPVPLLLSYLERTLAVVFAVCFTQRKAASPLCHCRRVSHHDRHGVHVCVRARSLHKERWEECLRLHKRRVEWVWSPAGAAYSLTQAFPGREQSPPPCPRPPTPRPLPAHTHVSLSLYKLRL